MSSSSTNSESSQSGFSTQTGAPQDVQPESGTRDAGEEDIRQSSPANPRVSEKSEEATEEA